MCEFKEINSFVLHFFGIISFTEGCFFGGGRGARLFILEVSLLEFVDCNVNPDPLSNNMQPMYTPLAFMVQQVVDGMLRLVEDVY